VNIRDELTKIYEHRGELTPKILVEEARSKKHPMHDLVYDVPVGLAAERYYLDRAHEIIQSVKVTYRDANTSKRYDIRAFHAIPSGEDRTHVYKPTDEVVNDPVLKALVLREMERDWRNLHARYGAFVEFIEMVSADLQKTA
jgi:hypothetical protein